LILIHLLFPTESLFIDNNVIDLSANNHFANCYVVNKPGHYSFAPCKLDGTLVHGDLAFWVWQEPNVIIDSLNYDNNNISFFVKDIGNGGNALIQLRDGHENPIWCWHIWITPNSTDQMTVQLKGGDWLACNLGASFLPKDDLKKMQKISDSQLYRTYGLYYQNGIPIPFIGGNYKGMNDVNYTNAFSQICVTNYRKGLYQAFKMTHEDPKTIEEAMSRYLSFLILQRNWILHGIGTEVPVHGEEKYCQTRYAHWNMGIKQYMTLVRMVIGFPQ
jgi:hypothetical protein